MSIEIIRKIKELSNNLEKTASGKEKLKLAFETENKIIKIEDIEFSGEQKKAILNTAFNSIDAQINDLKKEIENLLKK